MYIFSFANISGVKFFNDLTKFIRFFLNNACFLDPRNMIPSSNSGKLFVSYLKFDRIFKTRLTLKSTHVPPLYAFTTFTYFNNLIVQLLFWFWRRDFGIMLYFWTLFLFHHIYLFFSSFQNLFPIDYELIWCVSYALPINKYCFKDSNLDFWVHVMHMGVILTIMLWQPRKLLWSEKQQE